jgi:hypothetical protein
VTKETKPFLVDGEELASVVHLGSADGPLVIDIMMNTLTVFQARKLRSWLDEAIEEVIADRPRRNAHLRRLAGS